MFYDIFFINVSFGLEKGVLSVRAGIVFNKASKVKLAKAFCTVIDFTVLFIMKGGTEIIDYNLKFANYSL